MDQQNFSSSSSSSPPSSPHHTSSSSSFVSSFPTGSRSVNAVLPQPKFSVESSVLTRLSDRTSTVSSSRLQQILHPHIRFLNRSEANCPSHLSGKQRSNWLKAGRKAQENQQVLQNFPLFSWPSHNYDSPVFLNHMTSEFTLNSTLDALTDIRLFSIDTESTVSHSTQQSNIPSLIQIHALINVHRSIVLIIETQHLPRTNTMEFSLIQQICQRIFSSSNRIVAWGDPIAELKTFEMFNLFNCSSIEQPVNLQILFAQYWNAQNPHELSCPMSSSRSSNDFTDEIICMISSNDILDEYALPTSEPDSPLCTCQHDIRPYKTVNALWSLQKAIMLLFREALDKELTMSHWDLGIDHALHPFSSNLDHTKREALISYAVNDVITVARLFCHMYPSLVPRSVRTVVSTNDEVTTHRITTEPPESSAVSVSFIETPKSTVLNSFSSSQPIIRPFHSPTSSRVDKPLIYILSDSHGKHLSKNLSVIQYNVHINAVSGLRFVDKTNRQLCATTGIQTSEVADFLSNSRGIIFLIGTNSIRSAPSFNIIPQISKIVSILRANHPHLSSTDSITFITTFPCQKTSYSFPTISSLTENISKFNTQLISLSQALQFSVLDLEVHPDALSNDQLHLQPHYQRTIATRLSQYIDCLPLIHHEISPDETVINNTNITTTNADLIPVQLPESNSSSDEEASPVTHPKQTASSYKTRKNRRHHDKRHVRRLQNMLSRQVFSAWSLSSLKNYLRCQHIRFAFLSPIRNSILRIAFNDPADLTVAEHIITDDYFDEPHFITWSAQQLQQH